MKESLIMTDDDFKDDLAYLRAMADLILTYPPNQLLATTFFADAAAAWPKHSWPRDKAQTMLRRWRRAQ